MEFKSFFCGAIQFCSYCKMHSGLVKYSSGLSKPVKKILTLKSDEVIFEVKVKLQLGDMKKESNRIRLKSRQDKNPETRTLFSTFEQLSRFRLLLPVPV